MAANKKRGLRVLHWILFKSNRTACCHNVHRNRSRLIFSYRKLYLRVHWQVRDHNGSISCTEQTWSRITLPNLTKKVHLTSEKPHFQKHNRKTNPERYRMFGAERCTGTSPKQILLKINSALYSKQLAEQIGSSVLHWIFDQATELHATIMSQNSIQVDFPVQKIVLHSSLISSGS